MSSEIQESLQNFKVIVAFHRMDYFRRKFETANEANYAASVSAGNANNIFMPMYGLASHLSQLLMVAYGIVLIGRNQTTAGQLIGFLLYVNSFYGPMRQLATVWSSFQLALAALGRISEVLAIESDMPLVPAGPAKSAGVLEFRNLSLQYFGGKDVLWDVSFELEKWKAYALVGPTGGGKTTTASLMARRYDPNEGSVFLDGRDIRSVAPEDRSRKVGFIPQEPFLFTGTVRDNIVYGNDEYREYSRAQLAEVLEKAKLSSLLTRFSEGLDTKITSSGNSIALGRSSSSHSCVQPYEGQSCSSWTMLRQT
jgi:ATP-binding cassette subfamily B protein